MSQATSSIGFGGTEPNKLGLHHSVEVEPHIGALTAAVDLQLPSGRCGFGPALALQYGAGANSPYGIGWNLIGVPSIGVDLHDGVPRYDGSERYVFTGAGQLEPTDEVRIDGGYRVQRFRPRVEAQPIRVERWTELATGQVHWRIRDGKNSILIFGRSGSGLSRIADPQRPQATFVWLPELALDPKGNAVRYTWVAEDTAGVDSGLSYERGRAEPAQRYLKRIDYANTAPLVEGQPEPAANRWSFSVVFDYGDHRHASPAMAPDRSWPVRPDPFSSWRQGFEVRTHRLCRRILLFHNFDSLGSSGQLRAAFVLGLQESPIATTLASITCTRFRGTEQASLPPLSFTYTVPKVASQFVAADRATTNVPAGLTGAGMQFVDLYGEGIPGILYEQSDTWFYKANLGGGRFAPQAAVLNRPGCTLRECAIGDFDGDGNLDVAILQGRQAGFYEYDRDHGAWKTFRPFESLPHIEAAHSRAQWLDLNGDGRPDLLLSGPDRFLWFPSKGKEGFDPAVEIERPVTQASIPHADDPDIDFLFADMSGDGLAGQVFVRNGRVEYWPQTGNGEFAAPILMEDSPVFAPEDEFDVRRLVLADLTGNGASDLVYVGPDTIRYWLNCSGNRWIEGGSIAGAPLIDRMSTMRVFDFTGDGTPCLVWSSPLPDRASPLHYLPLTDDVAPNRLIGVNNNMGKTVTVEWGSSGMHYLRDQEAGTPWSTRMPRHTQVVNRLVTEDLIGGSRSVERFEYHDGYFDSVELESRGFCRVDRFDAEPGDPQTEPLCSRTWYHPGVPILPALHAAFSGDVAAPLISPHSFEDLASLKSGEYEDGLRSLAGKMLRQELYRVDIDGNPQAVPTQVIATGYRIRRSQPSAPGRHASFLSYPARTFTLHYEQQAADPRSTEEVILAVDALGNPTLSAQISHERRSTATADSPAQQLAVATVARHRILIFDEVGRLEGLPIETEEFEITGLSSGYLSWEAIGAAVMAAISAALDAGVPFTGGLQARRMGWMRTFYSDPSTNAALPLATAGAPSLLNHVRSACFTPALIAASLPTSVDTATLQGLGYLQESGYWWQSSPERIYASQSAFYLHSSDHRADGSETRFSYDASNLYLTAIEDALGNKTTAEIDYLELAPWRITDVNQNIAEARYDALGVIVASTSYGQILDKNGAVQAYGHSTIASYTPWASPTLDGILQAPSAFLQNVATATWYDLNAWQANAAPPRVLRLQQQDYVNDGTGVARVAGAPQIRLTYFDGFLRPLQSKLLVEGGPAIERDAGSLVLNGGIPAEAMVQQRWLTDGHVAFNGKQQTIREYEPFFSSTPAFEPEEMLAKFGVSQRNTSDGLGRMVRVDFPNGTFNTWQYLPWKTEQWDANDNILSSDYRTQRNGLANSDPEKQALLQSEAHAGTSHVNILNPAGLIVMTIHKAAAGNNDIVTSRQLDCHGQDLTVTDARGLVAFRYVRDMRGRELSIQSVDNGTLLTLPDGYDRLVQLWDARGVHTVRTWDALDRITAVHIDGALGLNHTVEQRVYGEDASISQAQLRNLRGRIAVVRDSSGVVVYDQYNLKGDLLRSTRQIRQDYKNEADWNTAATVVLEADLYSTATEVDALGRQTQQTLPDGSTRNLVFERSGGVAESRITLPGGMLTNQPMFTQAVYNARGQRTTATYGNGVTITHSYDPSTFRTTHVLAKAASTLMDLRYVYDPMGNIVWSTDQAQAPPIAGPFLQGINVSPEQSFLYDEFYQLKQTTGRVHRALTQYDFATGNPTAGWIKGSRRLSLNDGGAIERYTRTYTYDIGGNLTRIHHAGVTQTWNTDVWIAPDSNRGLLAADTSGSPLPNPAANFDAAGNCTSLPNLARVEFNFRNGIARAVRIDRGGQGPDDAEYYVYDSQGIRVRKVTERLNSGKLDVTDRVYLDGCDITRRRLGNAQHLERFTSHLLDGEHRMALVHRWTRDDLKLETDNVAQPRVRYQLTNHLGSSAMELDEAAALISYEEYFPFGGTSFLAGDQDREVAMRDYRFCGKENDEFTGLYYSVQRYYAPWIGRWMTTDPSGPEDTLNLYCYCRNNPVTYSDPTGLQPTTGEVHYTSVTDIPANIRSRLTRAQIQQIRAGTHGWLIGQNGSIEVLPSAEIVQRMNALAASGREVHISVVGSAGGGSGGGAGLSPQERARQAAVADVLANIPDMSSVASVLDPSSSSAPETTESSEEQGEGEGLNYTPAEPPVASSESSGSGDGTATDSSAVADAPPDDPNATSADPNGVPGEDRQASDGTTNRDGIADGSPDGTNPNGSPNGSPDGAAGDGGEGAEPEDTGYDIDWGTVAWSATKTLAIGAAAVFVGAALVAAGIISAPFLLAVGVLALIGVGLHSFFKRSEEAMDAGQYDRTGQTALAALGDAFGITGIYEGATGHDAVTDRRLRSQERSDRLGTGIGSVATVLTASRVSRLGTSAGQAGLEMSGRTLYNVPSISRPSVRNPLVTGQYRSPQGLVYTSNTIRGLRAGWASWRGGRGFTAGWEGRGANAVPGPLRPGAGNFWHMRSHFVDRPARPVHSYFTEDLGQHMILLGDAPYLANQGQTITAGSLVIEPQNVFPLNAIYPRPNGNPGWFVGTVGNPPPIGYVGGTAPNAGATINFGYRMPTRVVNGEIVPVTLYPE